MDRSRVFQINKEYSLDLGSLNINTFNGRALYSYPVASIGSGNYAIDVLLVYNSFYDSMDFLNKKIGLGNGWKLNYEQYLFKYDNSFYLDDFSINDYVYIDEAWCIHRFIKYSETTVNDIKICEYYDDSGTGLKLTIRNDTDYEISDEANNKYIFDLEGRLIRIISGINSNMRKEIIYNSDGNITSIYDYRRSQRKVNMQYNLYGNLILVSCTNKNISYEISYSNNKLIEIRQKSLGEVKLVQEYIYENDLIKYFINSMTNKAINVNYLNGKAYMIFTYFLKKKYETINNNSEENVGQEAILGSDCYLSNSCIGTGEESKEMVNDYITEVDLYEYYSSYTAVTNCKNIKMMYYFDKDGRLINNLELVSNYSYYTLSKNNGWNILNEGTESIILNGKRAIKKYNVNNCYNFDSVFSLSSFNEYLRTRENEYDENFNLSFYLFSNKSITYKYLKVSYENGDKTYEEKVILSQTLDNSWQLVNVLFSLADPKKGIKNLKIEVYAASTLDYDTLLYLLYPIINKSKESSICINNGEEYEKLKIGNKLYYYDNYEREVTLSSDFYLTANDIMATYKSIYDSSLNNLTKFDLFYCNKTRRKKVSYVSLFASSNSKHNDYKFKYYTKDGYQIPNYYFKSSSKIGETVHSISFTQKKIKDNLFEVENKIYTAVDGVITDKNYLITKEIRSGQELLLRKESTKVENDEITTGLKEIYTYNMYGLCLSKQIIGLKDTDSFETYYTYYDNEYVSKIKENDKIIVINYDENENVSLITKKYKKEETEEVCEKIVYSYDKFDNLTSVKHYDKNDNLLYESQISYNKEGNINKLSDSNVKYGFIYNALDDLCEVYRNKKIINKYVSKLSTINNESLIYLYQDNKVCERNVYDEYGRNITNSFYKEVNNEKTEYASVNYEYEDTNVCSDMTKRVKKITDLLANSIYEYTYDDKEGKVKATENGKISITNEANRKTIDILDDNRLVKQEEKVDNSLVSSSEVQIKDKDDTNNEWVKINNYSFDYEYDDFKRLKKAKNYFKLEAQEEISLTKEVKYYPNTKLLEELKYNMYVQTATPGGPANKNLPFKYTNVYDKGNVIKVTEQGNRYIKVPNGYTNLMDVAIPERVSTYVYDECNRLVRETTNGTSYEYVYGTSSHMLEKVYKNDCLVKTLKYENGMLTEIEKDGKINVNYDNYGNIKSIGSKNITYNKQGLVSSVNDIHFQYNYQGYRTRKIKENEKEVIYYLDNARIVGESVKTLSNNEISNKLRYYYDVSGICGIEYIDENNESHYYNLLKDSLGNVAKVMNYGRLIGEYTYDAWGNVTTKIYDDIEIDTIDRYVINNNPFRYKGYYYDIETNLYYCNARYYDPTIYQWLSPDSIAYLDLESINGMNLYCYCFNNPVNYYDPSGHSLILVGLSTITYYAIITLLLITAVATTAYYIESETHIIQNSLTSLGNAIVDLGESIGIEIENLFSSSSISSNDMNSTIIGSSSIVMSTSVVSEYDLVNVHYYKRKKAAPRIKSNSKKKAREKAFLKGGKRSPIHHSNGKHGPHYHPNDPRFSHWHYYYLWLLLLGYDEE